MPTTVSQKWQGAKIVESESSEIESEYIVFGTDDEFVAQAALDAATASTVYGLIKKAVQIDERLGDQAWSGTVKWGLLEPLELGDSQFSFDTTGGTAHVQTSIATVSATPAAGVPAAPNFYGAIGVTDNGVDGTDITAPAYAFQETHIVDGTSVTTAYKATLFSLTGCFNNASYKNFAAGECQFKGAVGTLKDYSLWEITYKFECIPNKTAFTAGGIVVPSKRGCDYLWLRYREVEDAAAGHLARVPIAAYVEQVAPLGSLALLGI